MPAQECTCTCTYTMYDKAFKYRERTWTDTKEPLKMIALQVHMHDVNL